MARREGAPSKKDNMPELLSDIQNYIDNHKEEFDDIIPSIEGLAFAIGMTRQTIHVWANECDTELSYILESLKAKQAKLLMNGGLGGSMNSTITKLILTKHGYNDKIDNTSSDGSMSPKASNVVVTSSDVESIISKI